MSYSGSTYVTVAQLKDYLTLTGQTYADTGATAAVVAASRAVDNYTGRAFGLDSSGSTRYYTPDSYCYTRIDDTQTVTSLSLDTSGNGTYSLDVSATAYTLDPINAAADGWPYTGIRLRETSGQVFYGYHDSVKVVATFGWAAVPGPVFDATVMLASRFLKRKREAPLGVYGFGLDGAAVRISQTDPDVCMLLDPYSRRRPFL